MLDAGNSYSDARLALRAICPQPLLNWREARFYGRYGEVELHLLEFLCRRNADAIDVGANDGSYVHYMRRHARMSWPTSRCRPWSRRCGRSFHAA